MKKSILLLVLALCGLQAYATKYYVSKTGAGAKTGSSWAAALDEAGFRAKLTIALPGDQFWVKSGVYFPHNSSSTVSFPLRPGVKVYGGFAGTESALAQRNWRAHPTWFSGDIGVPGLADDDSEIIWSLGNPTPGTTLDGAFIHFAASFGIGGGLFVWATGADGVFSATFKNLEFSENTGFWGAGAGILSSGEAGSLTVNFTDCKFWGNTATDDGAAIFAQSNGGRALAVKLIGCVFTENTAAKHGGAVYFSSENTSGELSATLSNCQFSANTAKWGGAAATNTAGTAGKLRIAISNSKFANNGQDEDPDTPSTLAGGAVYNRCDGASLALTATADTFQNNKTLLSGLASGGAVCSDGPGVFSAKASKMVFKNCQFYDNMAMRGGAFAGAGAAGQGSSAVFDNSEFYSNNAQNGGAIYDDAVRNRTLTVKNCFFFDNRANIGAAVTKRGNFVFERSTILETYALAPGATSVLNIEQGSLTQVRESDFTLNSASGGAILAISGSKQNVLVRNTKIANNWEGNAILLDSANLTLLNSTISANLGGTGGGLHFKGNFSKDALIRNSIIWGPTISIAPGVNADFQVIPSFSTITGGYGGASGADPLFQDPSNDQFFLMPGSPAINAGNNAYIGSVPFDLNGQARISDGTVDRGCYELQEVPAIFAKKTPPPATEDILQAVSIFPNPASEIVQVVFPDNTSGVFSLFRVDGGLVYALKMTDAWRLEIPIGNCPEGIYYWEWTGENGKFRSSGKLSVLR